MKATIERATLLKSLGHVQSVVERRNTIPILSNVLIEASGDPVSGASGLRLMATDLDLPIVVSATAHVDQPGETTVSAHTLFDIVCKPPDGAQVDMTLAHAQQQVVPGCTYERRSGTVGFRAL